MRPRPELALLVGVREPSRGAPIEDAVTVEGMDPVACVLLATGVVMGAVRGRMPLTEAREFAPRLLGPGAMRASRDTLILTHEGLVEVLEVLDECVDLAFPGADLAHQALVGLAPSALLNEAVMVPVMGDDHDGQEQEPPRHE